MAGHSKWANIKHKKAAQDAKRGKVFSKIVKKIASAARRGGGDIDANPELRLYVDKGRAVNMPSDNIQRAILKATGQLEGVSFEDFVYEGYGPGGVAVLLEGATDNKNRTVANIRHAFSKNGGNLGANGCVSWMFHDRGIITMASDQIADHDALMELALEHGAEDFDDDGEVITLSSAPEDFVTLRQALIDAGYNDFLSDELTKVAETSTAPELKDVLGNMRLIEILEDDDDIESVYTNLELSDEVAAALENE